MGLLLDLHLFYAHALVYRDECGIDVRLAILINPERSAGSAGHILADLQAFPHPKAAADIGIPSHRRIFARTHTLHLGIALGIYLSAGDTGNKLSGLYPIQKDLPAPGGIGMQTAEEFLFGTFCRIQVRVCGQRSISSLDYI